MEQKIAQFINKGMQQDYSISKSSNEFAYKNHNIRITTRGENSLLTVTNEKSNKEVLSIPGVILGFCVANDSIIIFSKDDKDHIYQVDELYNLKELYVGNLNFSLDNPIETLYNYESDSVEKIYWVDGLNPPRLINIKGNIKKNIDTQFDFNPVVNNDIFVNITKSFSGDGLFKPGTIQYIITYYNNYAQESAPVYISPLYYLSESNRGGNPEDSVSNTFTIKCSDLDTNWDNLIVYSIHRGALNSMPVGYKVKEITLTSLNSDSEIIIVDNGSNLETIDPSKFFFDNDSFIPSTLSKKGNKLFFGDLKTEDKNLVSKINFEFGSSLAFVYKDLEYPNEGGLYDYKNQLSKSEDVIKTFKGGEKYRFALQLQDNKGIWSNPIYLGDRTNGLYPKRSGGVVKVPKVKFDIRYSEIENQIPNFKDYTKCRLLMAEPTENDRTIVAQGILSPTVYNMNEAVSGTCHSTNSWIQRFTTIDRHLQNVNGPDLINQTRGVIAKFTNLEIPVEKSNKFLYITDDVMSGEKTNSSEDNSETAVNANITKVTYNLKHHKPYGVGGFTYTYRIDSIVVELSLSNSGGATIGNKKITIGNDLIIYPITSTGTYVFGANNPTKKSLRKHIYPLFEEVQEFKDYTFSSKIVWLGGWETPADRATESVLDHIKKQIESNVNILNVDKNTLLIKPEDFLSKVDIEVDTLITNVKNVTSINNQIDETIEITTGFSAVSSAEIQQQQAESKNQYFVDANILSFFSPEVDKIDSSDLKFRIVGCAALRHNISDYQLTIDNPKGSVMNLPLNMNKKGKYLRSHFLYHNLNFYTSNNTEDSSMYTGPVLLSLWHKSGPLSNREGINILKRKVVGNLWYCDSDYYADNGVTRIWWEKDEKALIKEAYAPTIAFGDKVYKKDYESLIIPSSGGFIHIIKDGKTPYEPLDVLEKGISSVTDSGSVAVKDELNNSCLIKYNSENHAIIQLPSKITLPGYGSTVNNVTAPVRISTGEEVFERKDINNRFLPYPIQHKVDFFNFNNATPDKIDIKLPSTSNAPGGVQTLLKQYRIPSYCKCAVIFWTESDVDDYFAVNDLDEKDKSDFISSLENNCFITTGEDFFKYIIASTASGGENRIAIYENNSTITISPSSYVVKYTLSKVKDRMTTSSFTRSYTDVGVYQINGGPLLKYTDLGFKSDYRTNFAKATILDNLPVFKYTSRNSIVDIRSDKFKTNINNKYWENQPCLWIGELYRDNPNAYGGKEGIYNNTFIVCGETTDINHDSNTFVVDGTIGDTYFQRWDCLRTYPTTEEDTNSIVDVVSTMIETHINLDGRYDNTRGRTDVANIRPGNINLINTAYSQSNNYFTYYISDERTINKELSNYYTWSLSKTSNELIDNWTKGLMVNTEMVDGAKGKITKLQLWRDYLLVFQERGIARIHYNDQTTIGTLEGVPVEIQNSTTVQGHNYLSELIGCSNKWSMAVSEAGIYFVDSISKSINLFNGKISNLTYNKALKDWSKDNINGDVWNPNTPNAYYGTYDRLNHEYYITNDSNCLCFSEDLDSFVSFYDYIKSPQMISFKDKLLGVQNNEGNTKLWEQFAGDDYCNFYGESKNYSIELNVNQEPTLDKIFNIVEFRANVRDLPNETFDNMIVSNEYQYGELLNINNISKYKYPNSTKKYRIWRLDIPRDKNSRRGLDRIRNPWIKLKLEKNTNTDKLMEMHDLLVKYYV